jgi:regulation of enolase protein 1 (concanavalin A-like superfamily)
MGRLRGVVVLGLAGCLLPGPAAAGDGKARAVEGWGTVIDPDGDCQVKTEKGGLTVTIPGTYHDLTHKNIGTKLNSPRVLRGVAGDFRLQVRVDAFRLPTSDTSSGGGSIFVSCGLLVWADEKNFVRLERVGTDGRDTPLARVELFRDGRSAFQQGVTVTDQATHLRITRQQDRFTFEVSGDGKEWTEIHEQEFKLPPKVQVGVLVINTTTREFSVRLGRLKVGPRQSLNVAY